MNPKRSLFLYKCHFLAISVKSHCNGFTIADCAGFIKRGKAWLFILFFISIVTYKGLAKTAISLELDTTLIQVRRAPWKSASAPPRGGAREPGRQLSAFHQDRANRLSEQTRRRVHSYAAPALRRGGGVENFSLGGWAPTESSKTVSVTLLVELNLSVHL